ncbi:hypothetical protein [Vallitalea sp.]|jgi:hypothetical protein|uniref:hypothetical protein n=1 Tax=Vallitalea sp. TaxID=1882829 RepID=UPI0025FAE2EC|nr:hypothetical protein [Vallitalea sp.]MCT4687977.1 hypothetical protein [Vallitalea sp.]
MNKKLNKLVSLSMVVIILAITFKFDVCASSNKLIENHQIEKTDNSNIISNESMYSSFSDVGILEQGVLSGVGLCSALTASYPLIIAGGVLVGAGIGAYALYNHLANNLEMTVPVYTNSLDKHLEKSAVIDITKKHTYTDLYYSPVTDKAMIVYNIDEHIFSDVSSPMGIPYFRTHHNVDLFGFKLIVLVELNHRDDGNETKFFHAEIRRGVHASRQIEFMRYKNQMSVQMYRNPSIDNKYLDKNGYNGPMASPYQMQK